VIFRTDAKIEIPAKSATKYDFLLEKMTFRPRKPTRSALPAGKHNIYARKAKQLRINKFQFFMVIDKRIQSTP
jgi:hypothetical protein